MITLDTTSINSGTDEIYSVEHGSKVEVFLNGDALKRCIYCNVTKGIAICCKRDLSDNIVVYNGTIVHEIMFGDITIEHIHEEEIKGGWTGKPTSKDFEVIKNALKD